jgi:hypothetical protein
VKGKKTESRAMKANTLSLIPFALLAYFATTLGVEAVVPPPDGGYANFTTAEGTNALSNLTSGAGNTAVGWYALFSAGAANFNTGVGAGTLALNTGDSNTATGAVALLLNTAGSQNTATGSQALLNNIEGINDTAVGFQALFNNTTITGNSGDDNTAIGSRALFSNTTGINNTAIGVNALGDNTTGNNNIGLGQLAGFDTTGDYNILIGNAGVSGASNTVHIGQTGSQTATFITGISGVPVTGTPVVVAGNDQLGVAPSARRFKDEVQPMDEASEAILALKPVTFRYKKEIDPGRVAQFGLVAEEVEQVNPALVTRDAAGKPYTVRYDAVNAMLLNEFLKEHKAFVKALQKVERLETSVASLMATVKEQAAQIQRVSAQLELNQPAPQTAQNTN